MGVLWKVTSQGDLIINSYLGQSLWAVTAQHIATSLKGWLLPQASPMQFLSISVHTPLK